MDRTQTIGRVTLAGMLVMAGSLPGSPVDARIKEAYRASARTTLAPGIVHEVGTIYTNWGGTQRVQVGRIRVGRDDVHVRSVLSNDVVTGLEPTSVIAAEHSTATQRVMLATNGDVSRLGYSGAHAAPHSLHISRGEVLVSQECAKPTLGIEADGRARTGVVKLRTRVDLGRGSRGDRRFLHVAGINTPRTADEIILYTPRFGASTLTRDGGAEVILDTDGRVRVSSDLQATVRRVTAEGGGTALHRGQMVLSGQGLGAQRLRTLRSGDHVRLTFRMLRADPQRPCGRGGTVMASWDRVVESIGGNFWLAHNGHATAPSAREYPAGTHLAPRTSVGVTKDGTILMVTVDGRQPDWSKGVTLAEMGDLMVSLGAVTAINLDGGGSTEMVVRQPQGGLQVTTRPCNGGIERHVSQALLVFKQKSGA